MKQNPAYCKCGQPKLASFQSCLDCEMKTKVPDICVCGQFVHVNGKLCVDCAAAHAAEKKAQNAIEKRDNRSPETPKLKLFKVTIPSQTIRGDVDAKKLVVGEITEYGFIQGREIVVLASDHSKLWDQCLRELGCEAQEVDLKVEEIKGPFKHGFVISYHEPEGL